MPTCPTGTYAYVVQPGDSLWLIAQRYGTTVEHIAALNSGLNLNNLTIGQIICIQPGTAGVIQPAGQQGQVSAAQEALNNLMRMLWEQHVYWTRLYLESEIFGLSDVQPTAARLLRNPKDFEAALRPLYGAAAAAKFEKLLTSHLEIASELVKAAKAGDSEAAADAEKRWYQNADEIAAFLNSLNPYWPAAEWRRLLHDHLAMTKTEAVDILTKKYEDGIAVFEKIEQEALSMADLMTQGIARQFPQHFG